MVLFVNQNWRYLLRNLSDDMSYSDRLYHFPLSAVHVSVY